MSCTLRKKPDFSEPLLSKAYSGSGNIGINVLIDHYLMRAITMITELARSHGKGSPGVLGLRVAGQNVRLHVNCPEGFIITPPRFIPRTL